MKFIVVVRLLMMTTIGYYITTASEHIEKQLDILSDMLFNSQFKGLKSEKDVVISENK